MIHSTLINVLLLKSIPSWLPHIDSSGVLDGLTSILLLLSLLILRTLIVRSSGNYWSSPPTRSSVTESRVTIQLLEAGRVHLVLRCPAPSMVTRTSNRRLSCATSSPCGERGVRQRVARPVLAVLDRPRKSCDAVIGFA